MAGYILYSLDWDKFRSLVDRPTPAQLTALGTLLANGLEDHADGLEEGDPIAAWPSDVAALSKLAAQRLALPEWYADLSLSGKALWEGVMCRASMDCAEIDVGFRADSDGVYWDVIELAWKHLKVVPTQVSDVALSAFGVRPFRCRVGPGVEQTRAEFEHEETERRASLEALGSFLGKFVREGAKNPGLFLERLKQNKNVSQEHKDLLKELMDEDGDETEEAEPAVWQPMHSMHAPDEVKKMLAELKSLESVMRLAKEEIREQYEEELMPALEAIAGEGRMLFVQVDT